MRQGRYYFNPNYQCPTPESRSRPRMHPTIPQTDNMARVHACPVREIIFQELACEPQQFCPPFTHHLNEFKRSTSSNDDAMRSDGEVISSETSCSYCCAVSIESIYFNDYGWFEGSKIEVYGNIDVSIPNAKVWKAKSSKPDKVSKNKAVRGPVVYLQADTQSDPCICFSGDIHEEDVFFDDDISNFSSDSCEDTKSSMMYASWLYSVKSGTSDGSVELKFKVERCSTYVYDIDTSC